VRLESWELKAGSAGSEKYICLILNYTEESWNKADDSMFSNGWCSSARADKMLIGRRVMHYDDAPGFSWWSSLPTG